jgi:hypothetical protein
MNFSKFNVILRDTSSEKLVLFNTLYGSTFFIDEKITHAIEEKDITQLDNDTREALYTGHMIKAAAAEIRKE